MAILKAYPTAKHLAEAKPKNIEKIVRHIKGNNFNITEIQALIETAQNSIYLRPCQRCPRHEPQHPAYSS